MMKEFPKLLIADKKGKIYDVPYLKAAGMKGGEYFSLEGEKLVKLHADSELFLLPQRRPVGYDEEKKQFVHLDNNPFYEKEPCYAVAAFLSPGYTLSYNSAYRETGKVKMLPLFSYAAVALYKNEFYAAGIHIDREKRQELKGMDAGILKRNVKAFRKIFPGNRLVRHLERCALCYGCPAAKNFFLKRYEAPLPTSPTCNARCIGCISYQPGKGCSITQPRITFVPSPEEIAEAALFHIHNVKDPVVSFGQGCEGEPLMVGEVLIRAVELIRKTTSKGIINLNTNASRPDILKRLFDKGLDSIRVSMNSIRENYYVPYYLPRGYAFSDVLESIKSAKKAAAFVSINYLVMPGFTDSLKESGALLRFLSKIKIDMIQWRNLNYDPLAYCRKLGIDIKREDMIGMDALIKLIKKEYPKLMQGYFNPSRERIRRSRT
jgi:MoaA/NifB/PqqE/SkfB family radical SAM enzyme